ncbi:hypothetical protein [Streptomyces sp. N35]|uniref:hypothetical protein n=1 Tax=Streptomyces sp. N35 TaxID=2795730 RepID=UPI0018F66F44|nr:hypothetical protein [Streptomyces sp. N35]
MDTQPCQTRRGEYVTYCASGETCPDCNKPIKTLERVWRCTQQRPTGPARVVYRHYDDCRTI